jgi:RNA 3'-terminal phosphate cyclase (ATP)
MAEDVVTLNGSEGEGGGQILRTALSLSLITGKPLRIVNIRAKRPNPGLRAQHLECVQAAQKISNAEVRGAALGSKEISFFPKTLSPGNYQFKIGTAGATSLLFQTILIPLCFSERESTLTLQGGTHVLWAPTFDYLSNHFRHFLARVGFSFDLTLERAGFYPEGGGIIHAKIRPKGTLQPLIFTQRGELSASGGLQITSSVANLPVSIAQRQNRKACELLSKEGFNSTLSESELSAFGKGTHIAIVARFDQGGCCYSALGERGKPAEKVAQEAAQKFIKFVKSTATVDQYLADQLMLPLSVVDSTSQYSTECVTEHILTNAKTIKAFLPVKIEISGEKGGFGTVLIGKNS